MQDILIVPEATKKGFIEVLPGQCYDATFPNSKTRRGRLMLNKSNCLTAANYDFRLYIGGGISRKITPVEAERLQTVPDNYTEAATDAQRYKMLGNGWTIDIIKHIFNYMDQNKPINVLSLFDGMSCGQLALQRAGIPVSNYYASEIDKHAIKVTMANFPNTQQLGSVTEIKHIDWKETKIDLIFGGSPCQGFSFAGKQLNFDDPRSALFFEFVRLLEEIKAANPNVKFLLENVKMKKEYQKVITDILGVDPVEINSALVSAQNRKRLYWTNINGGVIPQPEDRNISLKDVILDSSEFGIINELVFPNSDSGPEGLKVIGCAKNKKPVFVSGGEDFPFTFYETRSEKGKEQRRDLRKLTGRDTTPRGKESKIYRPLVTGKANCLVTVESFLNTIVDKCGVFRILSPIERERLQTLPDNYTEEVSTSQRFKMLGNGWTVNVISHIFSFLENENLIPVISSEYTPNEEILEETIFDDNFNW